MIPERSIADTILDFGQPLLASLGPKPSELELRNALQIVVTTWNAQVMALPVWAKGHHLEQLQRRVNDGTAPHEVQEFFQVLCARRAERFPDDPRAVGVWTVDVDGAGGMRFQCDARVPKALGKR